MKDNRKAAGRHLKHAAVYVLGIVLSIAAMIGGLMLPMPRWLIWTMSTILAAHAVCSIVAFIRDQMRQKRFQAVEAMEKANALRNQILADPDAEIKRIHRLRTVTRADAYVLLVLLLGCIWGAAEKTSIPIFLNIVLIGLLSKMIPEKNDLSRASAISREDYPLLYAKAEQARDTMDLHQEIVIFPMADSTAGILLVDDRFSLQIGSNLLYALTPEELEQVLLHEFAHYAPEPRRFLLTDPLDQTVENVFSFLGGLLLFTADNLYSLERSRFLAVAGDLAEEKADQLAAQKGNKALYASALAKIYMSELFDEQVNAFADKPFYSEETPPEDACTRTGLAYRRSLTEHWDAWMEILMRELPLPGNTHPTFLLRYESVGKPPITLMMEPIDTPWAREVRRFSAHLDRIVVQGAESKYAEDREREYLTHLRTIDTWEHRTEKYSADQLAMVLQAYCELIQYEDAEAFCDYVLEQDQNPNSTAFANFFKGQRLLQRMDERGVALMETAMNTNSNYLESGMGYLMQYFARTGDSQRLQAYQEKLAEGLQYLNDISAHLGLEPGDELTRTQFPDGRLPGMIRFMTNAGEGCIDKIWLVNKTIDETHSCSIFVLSARCDSDQEEEIYQRVFHYLDTVPDGWQYHLYINDDNAEKQVRRVPGALIFEKRAE